MNVFETRMPLLQVNLLSPKSDQYEFSLSKIHPSSTEQVMRNNNMITQGYIWYFDLSLSNALNFFFKEMYGVLFREFACEYWGPPPPYMSTGPVSLFKVWRGSVSYHIRITDTHSSQLGSRVDSRPSEKHFRIDSTQVNTTGTPSSQVRIVVK